MKRTNSNIFMAPKGGLLIIISIDKSKKGKYLYQQIYSEMKKLIHGNKLIADEKLPPKRKLANQLNLSINSVSNAYEQLLAEGYIYSMERSGYYVEKITHFTDERGKEEIYNFPEDLKENYEEKSEGWLSLSHMTTNLHLFPFKEWFKCEKMAIKYHADDMSQISHPQGPYIVRETIARMIALNRGVLCEPEQIVIGPGTQPLIRQIMTMFDQNADTKIGIENPGYSRMYYLFKGLKFNISPISINNSGISLDEVKGNNPDVLFITPSHQFPTGKIMTISRRIELLNWAAESESRYIIEDDYDSEYKYGTDNISSLQSLDRHHSVIYSGTFSKTMTSSLRISYLVLPPKLLRRYKEHYSNWIQGSSTLNLYTLQYFIETGEYAKHLKRMNLHYERIRTLFVKELKRVFKDIISIHDVPAGLHFFVDIKTNKTYEEVEENAVKEKIELYTLKRFKLDKVKPEVGRVSFVLGFANLNEKEIIEAVGRLYKVMSKN